MRKTWVLETDTKGTGARVVPLDDALAKPETEPSPVKRTRARRAPAANAPRRTPPRTPRPPAERTSTRLPPGHVRKKATGEIGRVKAVDPKAGTATVQWLKQGRTSTVPLASVSRR